MTLGRPGDLLGARYRLDHPMGSTGTAQTGVTEHWQAYDERLARAVTVRLSEDVGQTPLPGSAQAMLTTLAQLNHPNVAAVYDVGVTDELGGLPVAYAISEWTEGRTLGQIIASGPQPWPRTSAWGKQIAGGLAALHASGIAHGALGPNSVAIHDDRQVKILDAGVVPAQPGAGAFEQTVALGGYPDQTVAMGATALSEEGLLPAGAADDVYALGAMVWLATIGALPVFGVDGVYGPDRSPLLQIGAPPELAALLAEMLEADPARRPTAAAVERRFSPFAAVERASDTLPTPVPVVAPTQVIDPLGGTGLGARVTGAGADGYNTASGTRSRAAAAAAAAAAERDRRRRRGLLIGLVLLLAGIGTAVGLVLANSNTTGSPGPSTTATNTPSVAPSTGVVSLGTGTSASASPSTSSAPASSAAPTSASPSPSPSPSSASPSPSPSMSTSGTSQAGGGNSASASNSPSPAAQGQ